MLEEFCEIFEYLAQRLNCSPSYEVKRIPKNLKAINRFFEETKINSIDGIWEFLLFQAVLSENRYSRRVSFTLLKSISLNSIKRWNERTSTRSFIVSRFQRDRRLVNPLKSNKYSYSKEYIEYQRKKFWNTPRGFILCGEYDGLLYDEIECKDCQYKQACKSALTY